MVRLTAATPITTYARTVGILSIPLLFLALVVLLQWRSGAYQAEFGAHPDEAAHYVTGLMIRDYVAAGLPRDPMGFATRYYEHYPKVALGNWPPVFYVLQAGWTLLFSDSRAAVLLLMAVLTSLVALLVVLSLVTEFGLGRALLGGVLFVAFPLVQEHTAMVMTEVPVALFSFLAVIYLGRYFDQGRTRDSLLFGLSASAAIMTKGSGMVLVIVPVLTLLFTGRFDVVKKLNFWYPVPIVAVLCGPWTWVFRDVARAGWMEDTVSLGYTQRAVAHFPREFFMSASVVITLFALAGFVVMLHRVRRGTAPARWAVAASLVTGLLVFHAIVPASLDSRHLLQALPAWAMFAVAGVALVERRWAASSHPVRWLTYGVALAGLLHTGWMAPAKLYGGFAPVVADVVARPENANAVFLISSDASGEGMFIAETAMREKRPGHIIRRGSKVLATQKWSGRDYEAVVDNPADLVALLEKEGINFILVDDSIPSALFMPHHELVRTTVAEDSQNFALHRTYPVRRSGASLPHGISVYEVTYAAADVPAGSSPPPAELTATPALQN